MTGWGLARALALDYFVTLIILVFVIIGFVMATNIHVSSWNPLPAIGAAFYAMENRLQRGGELPSGRALWAAAGCLGLATPFALRGLDAVLRTARDPRGLLFILERWRDYPIPMALDLVAEALIMILAVRLTFWATRLMSSKTRAKAGARDESFK